MNTGMAQMSSAALRAESGSVNDRLISTLFLAALFHGIVILGISFDAGNERDPHALPTLEVLLVSEDLPQAPDNPSAEYLSQRTQLGSGNARHLRRTSSPPSSVTALDNPGTMQGNALTTQEYGQQTTSNPEVLASSAATMQIVHLGTITQSTEGPQQDALLMRSGPAAELPSNDLGEELALKGQRHGELLVTPSTRESAAAVYLDRWRRKVERVGTVHFPTDVRRSGLSGNPVLEVAIRSNGGLEDMVVRRTSGHAQLDQAALGILRLAAPFDPFPADLRKRYNILRFAYEWQFLAGELVDSTVRAPNAPD